MILNIENLYNERKRLFEFVFNRSYEWTINNSSKLDKIVSILSDNQSKDQYLRDILMCSMRDYFKGDLASRLAGLGSLQEWVAIKKRVATENIHPEIKCGESEASKFSREYTLAGTFIQQQYRYEDIVHVEDGDVVIDLGGCLGDTAIYFMENGAREVHIFEMNPRLLAPMRSTLASQCLEGIFVNTCAVADKNGACWIAQDFDITQGGQIYEDKKSAEHAGKDVLEVELITLDSFCKARNIKPDFIKMDIEGAELRALKGAAQILKECRPKLAISIYHSLEDRIDIPLYLANILTDYDFYCKKFHYDSETIFFGIPRKINAK